MMANELDPSTLEPLALEDANTGMGAKAAWPVICDFSALFESAYWNSQFTANADLPARKLASTAPSSEETEFGLVKPSSIVFFIQVSTSTPLSLLNAGLPSASTNAPPLPNSSTAKSQVTPSF